MIIIYYHHHYHHHPCFELLKIDSLGMHDFWANPASHEEPPDRACFEDAAVPWIELRPK